jgi:hypothetical protein
VPDLALATDPGYPAALPAPSPLQKHDGSTNSGTILNGIPIKPPSLWQVHWWASAPAAPLLASQAAQPSSI